MIEGVEFGEKNDTEWGLLVELGECIAKCAEDKNLKRGELLCVLSTLCLVTFTDNTPYKGDIKRQIREINSFCDYLKFMAKRNK